MTELKKYYYRVNDGEDHETYTCESWKIPDEGTEIWCTAWKRGQTIKPYGDGYHVYVGLDIYHCDEIMDILTRLAGEGYKWGIVGVAVQREQLIGGQWNLVKV